MLVSHGGTVINDSVGGRLGELLGWPTERTRQIARELQASRAFDPIDAHNPWSCQSVASLNTYAEKRVRLGELGALRERLEHSAPPPGE